VMTRVIASMMPLTAMSQRYLTKRASDLYILNVIPPIRHRAPVSQCVQLKEMSSWTSNQGEENARNWMAILRTRNITDDTRTMKEGVLAVRNSSEPASGTGGIASRRGAFLARIRTLAAEADATVTGPPIDLAADPPTVLPLGTATGPQPPASRVQETVELSGLVVSQARRFAAAGQHRLETVLGAAVLAALRRYCGESRLVLGLLRHDLQVVSLSVDDQAGFQPLVSRLALAAGPRTAERVRLPIVLHLDADVPSARPMEADLVITIRPAAGGLTAEFDPDRHEMTLVAALLRCAERLLGAGLAEPRSPLWDLPVLSADDPPGALEAARPSMLTSAPVTLIDLFEVAASRYAYRRALADARGGPTLTYRELAEYAMRLARELLTGSIRSEGRVAIFISRGDLRWVAACLAVLYAGAAWVPLDPNTPGDRVSVLLQQAGAVAVVTDRRLRERLPPGPWRVVDVDSQAGRIASQRAVAPNRSLSPRNLAYCIFTSGSTGTPQGVLVEHASVVNFVRSIQALFRLTPDDRFLQYASPGFDVSVFEIFVPLLSGASLWVVGDEERLSVESLSKALERERITVAELPPAVMDLMEPGRFPDLAVASVGGEPFAGSLVTRWSPGCRVINGYGATETTIGLIYKECSGQLRSAPPIGRPVGHHQVYVLDDRMRPVPFGAVGELYIGGPGLARGYLGNPALTAARFVPHPFSADGERLFRTGDLVRFDAAGDLLYLGRRDRQVKVRGQRLELGEIEAALTRHPDVRSAVADVVRTDQEDPHRLVAYAVAEPGSALDLPALRDYLARSLPGYMVPSLLTEVSAIPVNGSGKVDLRALAAATPAWSGSEPGPGPAGPMSRDGLTVMQRRVYEACVVKVFPGLAAVADADLFEAGGTSLQMMRLVALVRQAFRADVPMLAFLRRPTLGTLAGLVEGELARSVPQAELPRAPLGRELPLSPGQFGLWFMDGLMAGRTAYNQVEAYRLRGPLRPSWLRAAVTGLVERHEVLRTRIRARDGVPYQVVGEVMDVSWHEADLATASDPETAAGDAVARLAAEPFDLSAGRPVRAVLLRVAADDYVFAIITHHIASDGRSSEVMLAELSHLYSAFGAARPSSLAPLAVRYADFAWWQRERLRGEQVGAELAYWRERLTGAPPQVELPFDWPRPTVQGNQGGTLGFDLPAEAVAAAREAGRAAGATLFMTLSAAFFALLARYSRSRDILIGTPVANRTREELHDMVGFLANMMVLRVDCSDDPSFADLLGRVKHATIEGSAHSELPFERLVDELQPERDLCRHPIFQVTFQVYDALWDFLNLTDISAGPFHIEDRTCRFDLSIAMVSGPGERLSGMLNYNTELFERATAARIADHYVRLLVSVLGHPGQRISEVEILGPDERRDLLTAVAPAVTAPRQTISGLVDGQAAAALGQVAVTRGPTRVALADLDAEAGRLATVLRSLGAAPGEVVAVRLERGPALAAALLAIARTGATYLPANPADPLARAGFMFQDSRVRIAVTQQSLAARLPATDEVVIVDDLPADTAAAPVGGPAGDTHVYVLDDYLNLVPQNVVGELYVGGAVTAHGCAWRPGMTAERFIADPFGSPGGRLYRTGEMVRRLPGGYLEFAQAAEPEPQEESGGGRTEPQSGLEATVAEVWEEVLVQEDVRADANFFMLGGSSLDATLVAARLAARFGVEFPLTSVFLHPTVAGTAREISRLRAVTTRQGPESADHLPLTPSQGQVWLLDRLQPGRATYNVAVALHLRGNLDRDALRLALREIVARHEVLRSRFVRGVGDWPVQVAEPPEVFDVAEDTGVADMTAALAAAEREARRPFDLSAAPPIRARLISLIADGYLLTLTAHHIAVDGWSIEVLLSELQELYVALRGGSLPDLAPVATQYRDEVMAQCASLDSPDLPEHLAYWRQHLAGLPPLNLTGDRPRPRRASGNGARHQSTLLSRAQTVRLAEMCAVQGATAFTVLLAALQVLLTGATGQRDIAVAVPISLRDRPGTERLIGFLANTLVIRADLSGVTRFAEVLERTRATMLAVLSHQDVPFHLVVEALNPRRDATRTPLFQVLFSLQDERRRAISLPELETEIVDIHTGTAKCDLDIVVIQYPDTLDIVIEYSTDIFNEDTIGQLAENYRTILDVLLMNPESYLADLMRDSRGARRSVARP
jgi:amino acid adenylation domain-containing protein